jgi:hypothetical protein
MPSGISILGSNNGGITWRRLVTVKDITWNKGKISLRISKFYSYTLYAVVIISLSSNNDTGIIGQIQLLDSYNPITSTSTLYDRINSVNYMSYKGFKLSQIGGDSFTVSYTPSITSLNGPISTENIQNLVCSDLQEGDFGILSNKGTYSNGKPNNKAPVFKIQ